VNVGKNKEVDNYAECYEKVAEYADAVVLNLSSPNTPGLRDFQKPEQMEKLLRSIDRKGPVLVKIAPDLDDAQIEDVLAVVNDVGLEGVVATNTTIARDGLRTDAARVAAIGAGGLSGAPLRERVVPIVRRVRARPGPRAPVTSSRSTKTAPGRCPSA